MPALIDLSGQRFGRLVAVRRTGTKSGHALWLCVCDCGNHSETTTNNLRKGGTSSCGCLRKESAAAKSHTAGMVRGKQMIKHGKAGMRLYNVWKSMRQRCNNPNDKYYSDYGGRGIRVCEEWHEYQDFHDWAMLSGYDPDAPFGLCTIDRIDVNKGYYPGNCRWVDVMTQANNRRKRRRASQ